MRAFYVARVSLNCFTHIQTTQNPRKSRSDHARQRSLLSAFPPAATMPEGAFYGQEGACWEQEGAFYGQEARGAEFKTNLLIVVSDADPRIF